MSCFLSLRCSPGNQPATSFMAFISPRPLKANTLTEGQTLEPISQRDGINSAPAADDSLASLSCCCWEAARGRGTGGVGGGRDRAAPRWKTARSSRRAACGFGRQEDAAEQKPRTAVRSVFQFNLTPACFWCLLGLFFQFCCVICTAELICGKYDSTNDQVFVSLTSATRRQHLPLFHPPFICYVFIRRFWGK